MILARTVVAFSVLILVLCVGCPQLFITEVHHEHEVVEPVVTPEPNRPEPHVEPLVPRVRPAEVIALPEGASDEASDEATEGTAEGASEEATEEEPLAPEMIDMPEMTDAPEVTGIVTGIVSTTLGKYAVELDTSKVVPLPPVADLVAQVDYYMTRMGRSMDFLRATPRYVASAADVVRDSNALALIALAIGLAEEDSKYKGPAPHIIAAAQSLAAAQNYPEGRRAFEALRRALTNTEEAPPLSWSDGVAGLTPVMQALPNLSSAVNRTTDTELKLNTLLDRQPQQVFSQLAALAAISQGSIPLVAETELPDAVEDWKRYCEEFRDAAIKANAAAHQFARDRAEGRVPDYSIFRTAFLAMRESCDDCHRVFYPRAVGMD